MNRPLATRVLLSLLQCPNIAKKKASNTRITADPASTVHDLMRVMKTGARSSCAVTLKSGARISSQPEYFTREQAGDGICIEVAFTLLMEGQTRQSPIRKVITVVTSEFGKVIGSLV
uniref:Uncharacterized protein n=1 Tax=Photinus pyralis TaxID=7054 RepID=A0A1Y1JRF3_PHOPY